MRHTGWLAVLVLTLVPPAPVLAHPLRAIPQLALTNRRINGKVLDYTHNHGRDNRIWSEALHEKRDLYVYLPPGFDPNKRYPLVIWLHAMAQDEYDVLRDVFPGLDRAITCGQLPPLIIASPDGSLHGLDCWLTAGSFFLNSEAGAFEDYLLCDVWDFLVSHFPIRPEREAHALVGVSMGGGAAYNKALKFPERFGVVAALFPPLNWRWQDCHGNYRANFDPCCWGWKTDFEHRGTLVARFYGIPVRLRRIINPLYSRHNPRALDEIISNNPIEMLDHHHICPGQVQMFIGYGGCDQFNIDAQVESFLYVARQRGLEVTVAYEPHGRHDRATAKKLTQPLLTWIAPLLWPYAPDPE